MSQQKIIHLLDDATAGGVVRTVSYLATHPELSENAEHQIIHMRKGALSAANYDADIIISHTTLSWRGLPGLISLRAKNPKARLIHVEHSYTGAFTAENVRRKSRFFAMLRLGYAIFDSIVAVSQTQACWIVDNGLTKPDTLHVIPPMVDTAPFEAIRYERAQSKTIGAIGRLERQKGFDILIDGFRALDDPDARLFIYGDGSERVRLQELAADDPRITFKGHAKDPADAMQSVSMIAMPSRWEAYGLVALEAIAAGRDVICSNVDGLSDTDRAITYRTDTMSAQGWTTLLARCCAARQETDAPTNASIQDLKHQWVLKWGTLLAAAA